MDDDGSKSKKRSTPESRSPVKPAKKSKVGSASTAAKSEIVVCLRLVETTKKSKEGTGKTAPKKEYTEKEGYGVVLQYINEQNKPFNAQTIFDNLHKTVKKAFVVRILAQLAQECVFDWTAIVEARSSRRSLESSRCISPTRVNSLL